MEVLVQFKTTGAITFVVVVLKLYNILTIWVREHTEIHFETGGF